MTERFDNVRMLLIDNYDSFTYNLVQAFAAQGADIYAPAEHARFLEQALNSDTMPRDRYSSVGGNIDVLPVSDVITLGDPENIVRLLSIGAGPHASAALGVHAVDAGFFFVSDLHVPRSEDETPRVERATTECWFASWAVASLPPDTVILNSHSAPQTPVARLEKYLQSDTCRALAE